MDASYAFQETVITLHSIFDFSIVYTIISLIKHEVVSTSVYFRVLALLVYQIFPFLHLVAKTGTINVFLCIYYSVFREENDKVRAENRDHIRSYLCQNDQMVQLTKRLTEAEKNLQRARGEVFRLKLKIEEMESNENASSNASPSYTVPPTRVMENLKFVLEKKEIVSQPEKPLKERVVLENQLEQNTLNSSSLVDEITDKEKDSSVMVSYRLRRVK